ncbi:glycosyltransferase, partial [Candidatus Roizmanbacteria bacterium]|nr:glycosyltransferase [Candidatus Roizmanbacteria bacterium]
FIEMVNTGYDLIIGWRKDRKDPLSKRLPSYIFNALLLKFFFKSKFNDINCGYKAMNRKILEEIPLYGDNYRFLPIMAEQAGFKTAELVIKHHPRRFGKSKYGFFRLLSGLFDTITTYFIYQFSDKPLHFFGPIGGLLFVVGSIITIYLSIRRIFFHMQLYRRPLLLFGILLITVGIQFVMTGIIAELLVYLQKKNT